MRGTYKLFDEADESKEVFFDGDMERVLVLEVDRYYSHMLASSNHLIDRHTTQDLSRLLDREEFSLFCAHSTQPSTKQDAKDYILNITSPHAIVSILNQQCSSKEHGPQTCSTDILKTQSVASKYSQSLHQLSFVQPLEWVELTSAHVSYGPSSGI